MAVRVGIAALILILMSCGFAPSNGSWVGERTQNTRTEPVDTGESDCVLPSDATMIFEDQGLVLKVWTFPLDEVHLRPVLPNDSGFLAYRATIHAEGADEMYPMLHLPPSRNEAEADIWRDENFNNHLAYEEGIGSIEPITCLDALLFAEQNARVPQLDRPTEFLASVLRKRTIEQDEAMQPSARSRGSALVRPNTKPHSRSIPYRYCLRYLLCKSCNDDFGCRIEGFAKKAPAA